MPATSNRLVSTLGNSREFGLPSMDRLFDQLLDGVHATAGTVGWSAPWASWEDEGHVYLEIELPGVKAEDVEITAQQDMLSLKWETKVQAPEGATTLWHGFQNGQYQQSFSLPSPINADRAEAHYTDGILTLSLPKAEHAKARTVKVNAQ